MNKWNVTNKNVKINKGEVKETTVVVPQKTCMKYFGENVIF